MDVAIVATGNPLPKKGDLYLQYTIQSSKNKKMDAVLTMPSKGYEKSFVLSLQKELRDIGVPSKVHRSIEKRSTTPHLLVQMNLAMDESSPSIDQIAICLASGILRYFQKKHPMTLLSSLSPELREAFMSIVPDVQREAVQMEPPQPEVITTTSSVEEQPLVASVPEVQQPNAEVFFDYNLISPEDADSHWLIIVNMLIKNTGTAVLTNPIVELKTSPPANVKVSGKILPPGTADILGAEGAKMWQYLDKDWSMKGKDLGEYRIGPTDQLVIQPGETETNSFQLTVIKSKEEGNVSVEGTVHFAEQRYQCTSNNRIALSL
jgi:hypothetical protein